VRSVPTGRALTDWADEIEDYQETVGQTREYIANENGNQQDDPRLAARAIITAVEAAETPLRLVLGADALEGVLQRLSSVKEETNKW